MREFDIDKDNGVILTLTDGSRVEITAALDPVRGGLAKIAFTAPRHISILRDDYVGPRTPSPTCNRADFQPVRQTKKAG